MWILLCVTGPWIAHLKSLTDANVGQRYGWFLHRLVRMRTSNQWSFATVNDLCLLYAML
jgi:hypothetical protein